LAKDLTDDPSNVKRELGIERQTCFEELIRLMVDTDYELLSGVRKAARPQLGRTRSEAEPGAELRRGEHAGVAARLLLGGPDVLQLSLPPSRLANLGQSLVSPG
jgi:hypothetical protein